MPEPSLRAPARPPLHAGRSRRRRAAARRRRVGLVLVLLGGLAVVVALISRGGPGPVPAPPRPRPAAPLSAAGLFSYSPALAAQYTARATVGNAHVLFAKSPGGVPATAARVAAWRPLIDRVTAGTGVDPALLEALVFVESAGRPEAIVGADPVNAAGLTQIVASTGQSLLGMRIDLAASRRLTARLDAAQAAGAGSARLHALEARRAAADPRFQPAAALDGAVRYLRYAYSQLGRWDLALESYHMGIGNLRTVLGLYGGGRPVPYVQLYFDSSPLRHARAYALLSSFGDDSSLYEWRVLAAERIMRLWRSDRAALDRMTALQQSDDAGSSVLHPHARGFAEPRALAGAYQGRAVVPLPSNPGALGLAWGPQLGAGAHTLRAPIALYRGLRPGALAVLLQIADQVRRLSRGAQPLQLTGAVADRRYIERTGLGYPAQTTGWSFSILRRYVSGAQAGAFQAVLDRMQSLDAIAWAREPLQIDITAAADGTALVRRGL